METDNILGKSELLKEADVYLKYNVSNFKDTLKNLQLSIYIWLGFYRFDWKQTILLIYEVGVCH